MEDERNLEYWEKRLDDLTSTVTYTTSYEYRNGDVYGGDKKETIKGSKEEIEEARKMVAKYKNLVEQNKKFKQEREDKIAIEKYREQSSRERLHAFKQAQRRYKNKNIIIRAINKISGKSPNWKGIREDDFMYDTEKLDSMYRGKK